MDPAELRDVDLTALSNAVDRWEAIARALRSVRDTVFTDNLTGIAGEWRGAAAEPAIRGFTQRVHALNLGYLEAVETATILTRARDGLATAHRELSELYDAVADEPHLTITEHGTVRVELGDAAAALPPELYDRVHTEQSTKADDVRRRLDDIVCAATDIDGTAAAALTRLGEAADRFHPDPIDDPAVRHRLTALAAHDGEVTELAELAVDPDRT